MRAAHWAGFSRAVQQGRFSKEKVSLTIVAKDGHSSVEFSAAMIWGPGGMQGIAALGRDVSEHRAHEQTQQERVAFLARQVATLTARSERTAARLERSKGSQ